MLLNRLFLSSSKISMSLYKTDFLEFSLDFQKNRT